MKNEHAGSDCSEGCAGYQPLAGDPWSPYALCTRKGSINHGFPIRSGRPCRGYFPKSNSALKQTSAPDAQADDR